VWCGTAASESVGLELRPVAGALPQTPSFCFAESPCCIRISGLIISVATESQARFQQVVHGHGVSGKAPAGCTLC
jgi:hypothetical protein